MGSIAVSVAGGTTVSDLVSPAFIGIMFSSSLLFLLGAAHVLGSIDSDHTTQHQMLLVGASLPFLSTFLTIIIIESLQYINI